MRRNDAVDLLDFALVPLDRDLKRIGSRLERNDRGRKRDDAFPVLKIDLEFVAPMFAKLLRVLAALAVGTLALAIGMLSVFKAA
jgi:hypothetical protein